MITESFTAHAAFAELFIATRTTVRAWSNGLFHARNVRFDRFTDRRECSKMRSND